MANLQAQLKDACEEATRSVARTLQHTEVYGLRTDTSGKRAKVITGGGEPSEPSGYEEEGDLTLQQARVEADDERAGSALAKGSDVASDMKRALNDQFMNQGVEITDVIITDVDLPDVIVRQMSEKTTVTAQNAGQKMTQEYEMLSLKQEEEIATLKQRKSEEREKEKQTGDQKVNEVQVQLDKMKAETKVQLAKIRQESSVKVQEITAIGELEQAKLEQAKDALLSDKRVKAERDAQQLKSETEVYEQTKLSEARLAAARNLAQSDELIAKAEGVAAGYVEARRQFETRKKQMQV